MFNAIEAKVREVVKAESDTDRNEIGLRDNLGQYGINSINFIRIIVRLEKEYGIEFSDQQLLDSNRVTIEKLVSYIDQARLSPG
jgi:acyl carrier protein